MLELMCGTRRSFLQNSACAALAVGGLPGRMLAQETEPPKKTAVFEPDVELLVSARPTWASILPGKLTAVLRYEISVAKGPSGIVTNLGGALSPMLRLRKGQTVRVRFRNESTEDQIIHWHGLHVPEAADGHPRYAVKPQNEYLYEFEIRNRAGTYLYHSHTDGLTGPQVYRGLAGVLIVNDDEEQGLNLPADAEDVPIVIQDRRFDEDNQLVYLQHRMEGHFGFLGDRILVNGQPDFVLSAEARPHRLRVANMSNSRIYKLAWSNRAPLTVIATDGGLLAEPVKRPYVTLAPTERVDIWADFSEEPVGSELTMVSRPFSAGFSGMMMHGMGGPGAMGHSHMGRGGPMHRKHGMHQGDQSELSIFRIRIDRPAQKDGGKPQQPVRLAPFPRYTPENAANHGEPRSIELSFGHNRGFWNGRSFELTAVAPDERIPVNSLQLIEFINPPGRGHGMMAAMPHPMHIHEQQFQIVSRESFAGWEADHAELNEGFVDEGLKDTVLVLPGQRVTILKPFDDFTGLFLYHCHNLEHEDRGMMRNFLVV